MADSPGMNWTQGDDIARKIKFSKNGVALDITDFTIFFTVKDKENDPDSKAKISIDITTHTNPTAGETLLEIPRAKNKTAGNFFYNFKVLDASNKIVSTKKGKLQIDPNITIRES